MDESTNSGNERLERHCWTPVAQTHSVREATRERFLQEGTEACAPLTLRVRRTATKRAIARDLTAWLENLVSEASDAAARGDMGRVFAVTKKLKSGHDKPHKVIKDESGVLLVEEEMVAGRWRRHWVELLQGQENKWSDLARIARAHEKQHARRGRMNLVTLHDVATALGKRTSRKATGPSGISINVWQAGGESSVRILAALLDTTSCSWQVCSRQAGRSRARASQEQW